MLEYSKIILDKVSFNSILFEKELGKALELLTKSEKENFLMWCKSKFDHNQNKILQKYTH